MDKEILETIKNYYGDLIGVKTEHFYEDYVTECKSKNIKPREKNVVIREACAEMGIKVKHIHVVYGVFTKEGE